MIRTATLALMVGAVVAWSPLVQGQIVESTSVSELQDMVRQLIRENAQLKMDIDGLRRELEKYKSEGVELKEDSSRAVTIVVDSIRDLSDDGERRMRLAELKKEKPAAQTQVEKTKKKYEDLIENNALDKKKWDNYWPPYGGPRKPGARWEKPHSDEVLGLSRLEVNKATKHRDAIEREIKKLERGPVDLQVLIVGKTESMSETESIVEYQVMFEGTLAKRAQTKKRGDRICVTGLTNDSDAGYTAMTATSLADAKVADVK